MPVAEFPQPQAKLGIIGWRRAVAGFSTLIPTVEFTPALRQFRIEAMGRFQRALRLNREDCKTYAASKSWRRCTEEFVSHLALGV